VQQAVPGALDPNDPQTEATVALAAQLAADETQLLYSVSLHGRNELNLAPDEYSGLVMVLLRLLAFRPESGAAKPAPTPVRAEPMPVRAEPVEAPRTATATATPAPAPALRQAQGERVAGVTSPVAPVPVPAPTPTPSSGSSVPPWEELPEEYAAAPVVQAVPAPVGLTTTTTITTTETVVSGADQERWIAVARSLIAQGTVTAMTRELVMQAGCVRIDTHATPPCWVLQVERETLRQDGYRDRLLAALRTRPEVGEATLLIQVGAVHDSMAKRDAADRAQALLDAEKTIEADPVVQSLLARFPQSRIVPGSIRAL
jgi:DNA polymerase-3 subunit gamma/tau